jgi:hypothetical protein
MRHNVIKAGQVHAGRRGEIGGAKVDIDDCAVHRKSARMLDMGWHQVDAIEATARMRRREDCGRYPLSTAQLAKREPGVARRRDKSRYDGYMIEPSRRQFVKKSPHIRNVCRVAAQPKIQTVV